MLYLKMNASKVLEYICILNHSFRYLHAGPLRKSFIPSLRALPINFIILIIFFTSKDHRMAVSMHTTLLKILCMEISRF